MASHINAGIPSSKWVNPPKLSPYKNCKPLVPNRTCFIYIRLILNCRPIIIPFPSTFNHKISHYQICLETKVSLNSQENS